MACAVAGSLPFDWYNALDAVNRTYSESQFDTIYHALRFEGTITNDTVDGSYVCVWNFLAINLSPNTTVNIVGDKPMVLMSVSTAIIDTPLVLPPGQLGVRRRRRRSAHPLFAHCAVVLRRPAAGFAAHRRPVTVPKQPARARQPGVAGVLGHGAHAR